MGTHPIFESDFDCLTDCENGGSQRTPKETDLGKEAKTKPAGSKLDSIPNRKYHQVQCQETSLETNQDRFVNSDPYQGTIPRLCQRHSSLLCDQLENSCSPASAAAKAALNASLAAATSAVSSRGAAAASARKEQRASLYMLSAVPENLQSELPMYSALIPL